MDSDMCVEENGDLYSDYAVEFDIGNLTAFDPSGLPKQNEQSYLNCATKSTQLIFNQIWKLPREVKDNIHFIKLPKATTKIPREKPLPTPKPLTKWQEFAAIKGIKPKEKKVWNDEARAWVKRAENSKIESQKWFVELPNDKTQFSDKFIEREKISKERASKNEKKRIGNIIRAGKRALPEKFLAAKSTSEDIRRSLDIARGATASIGKYTEGVKGEKAPKDKKKRNKPLESIVGDFGAEKSRHLALVDEIVRAPVKDIAKKTRSAGKTSKIAVEEDAGKKSSGRFKRGKFGVKRNSTEKVDKRGKFGVKRKSTEKMDKSAKRVKK